MIGSFRLYRSPCVVVSAVLLAGGGNTMAQEGAQLAGPAAMPPADALFARKGCVACHAVNEIGGTSAPPLDVARG